jgi:putative inorganic carbon (hco3(-)) transporter
MSRYGKISLVFAYSLLILGLVLYLQIDLKHTLVLITILYAGLLLMLVPSWGILALILIRPGLDIFTQDYLFTIKDLSFNISSILGITIIVISSILVFRDFKKLKKIPLKIPISIFLLVALISSLLSRNLSASYIELSRLLSIFFLYIISYIHIEKKRDFFLLVNALIISTVVPSIWAVYQYFTNTGMTIPLEGITNRIYGTFTQPNLFAYYLVMPILFSIFFILNNRVRYISDALRGFWLPIMVVLIGLTFTRGAWLCFVLAMLITAFIRYKRLFVAALIVIAAIFIFVPQVNQRVSNVITDPYSSFNWRIKLWTDGFSYTKEKFFLGQGTGTAKEYILEKRGPEFGSSDPHNDYLKISLENGIIGLAAYLFLILSQLLSLFLHYRNETDHDLKEFSLFALSFVLSMYLMSFADNILRNTALMWAFWIMIGGLLAVKKDIPRHIEN